MDTYQAVTDRIVAALERGVGPWVRPWGALPASERTPYRAKTRRPYHGINLLLTTCSGYGDARWYTFRDIREAADREEKAGRKRPHVRKGEHATPVVWWGRVDRETTQVNPDTGEEEISTESRLTSRLYNVFNAEQVNWMDAREGKGRASLPDEPGTSLAVAETIRATGAVVKNGVARACYYPGADEIHMPPKGAFRSPAEWDGTLLHELTHWTGGRPDRTPRVFGRRFGDNAYGFEELIAELGSAYLCCAHGVTGKLQHEEYLASWLRTLKADKYAVFTAAREAQRAAAYVLACRGGKPTGTDPAPEAPIPVVAPEPAPSYSLAPRYVTAVAAVQLQQLRRAAQQEIKARAREERETPATAPATTAPAAEAWIVGKRAIYRAVEACCNVADGSCNTILSNVMLRPGDDGAATLQATDLATTCEAIVYDHGGVAPHCVVNARALLAAVKPRDKGDDASLLLRLSTDGTRLSIAEGRSARVLLAFPIADYPRLPAVHATEPIVHVAGDALRRILTHAAPAISEDRSRPNLQGIKLDVGRPGLRATATDGHRIHQAIAEATTMGEGAWLIGPKAVKCLQWLGKLGDVVLRNDGRDLVAACGCCRYITRPIDEAFPDYHRAIPRDFPIRVCVSTVPLVVAFREVSTLLTAQNKCVRLSLTAGSLTLSTINPELGESTVTIPVDYAGLDWGATFNRAYLADALKRCGDDVTLEAIDADSMLRITDCATGAWCGLMPLRV